MSGSVFTLDPAQGEGLGTTPGSSGVHLNAARRRGSGAVETWYIELEDETGFIELEDGSGLILLEDAP